MFEKEHDVPLTSIPRELPPTTSSDALDEMLARRSDEVLKYTRKESTPRRFLENLKQDSGE